MKGKWWRPEDLGIVDYSQQSLANSSSVIDALIGAGGAGAGAGAGAQKGNNGNRLQSVGGPTSLYNDQDVLVRSSCFVFACLFAIAASVFFSAASAVAFTYSE